MSQVIPGAIPVPVSMVQHSLLTSYFEVASIALLAYDIITMLSQERRLIWSRKSQWNSVDTLYLFVRYSPLIDIFILVPRQLFERNIAGSVCYNLEVARAVIQLIAFPVDEVVLIMRTRAIWSHAKSITWSLFILLALVFGASVVVSGTSVRPTAYIGSPIPSVLPGCLVILVHRVVWVPILFLLVFETVILWLTLYKLFGTSRVSGLVKTIYRDGIIFYFYVFVLTSAFVVNVNTAPDALAYALVGLHRVLHSICTSRVIIHIREASAEGSFTQDAWGNTTDVSDSAVMAPMGSPRQWEKSKDSNQTATAV